MSLGASVAPSPARSPARGSLLTIKPIFVVTCRWPAPLHPVASKGMVNQAFSCAEACWACSTALLTPLRLPEGSQLSGASRKLWFCTPCCCVILMPWFFFFFFLLCCGSLDSTTKQTDESKCEHTQNTLYSQERT